MSLADLLNQRSRHNVVGLDLSRQIEVINRTSRRLYCTVDGRTFTLEPGKNTLPGVAVPFAIRQNPRFGTFDETGYDGESLIAVPGVTPDEFCTMLPPGETHKGRERWDRKQTPLVGPHQTMELPKRARPADAPSLEEQDEARSQVQVENDSPQTFVMPPPSVE